MDNRRTLLIAELDMVKIDFSLYSIHTDIHRLLRINNRRCNGKDSPYPLDGDCGGLEHIPLLSNRINRLEEHPNIRNECIEYAKVHTAIQHSIAANPYD